MFFAVFDCEFFFMVLREYGYDVVEVIWVMCDGHVCFFMVMGGNFILVTFDIEVVEYAMC